MVSGYLTSLFLFIKIGLTYGLSYWMVIVKENLSKENLLYGSLRVQFILSRSLVPNHFWFKTKANIRRKKKKKHFEVFVYFTRTKSTLGNSGKYNPFSHRGVVGVLYESRPERKDKQSAFFFFLFSHFQTSHL